MLCTGTTFHLKLLKVAVKVKPSILLCSNLEMVDGKKEIGLIEIAIREGGNYDKGLVIFLTFDKG